MPKKQIHVMTPWLRLVNSFGESDWRDSESVGWVCGTFARRLFTGLVGPVRFHASTRRLPQSHRCKIIIEPEEEDSGWYSVEGDFGMHLLTLFAEEKLKRAGLGPGDTIYIAAEVK